MQSTKTRMALEYLVSRYPYPADLSKARLTKLLYLADWRMALEHGRQITGIEWYFNHYGPYVTDIEELVRGSDSLEWQQGITAFGNPKETVRVLRPPKSIELDEEERAALDHAIKQTSDLNFTGFLNLVYSTYPVRTSTRYSTLELAEMASRYRAASSS